jgi:hypothetical protein
MRGRAAGGIIDAMVGRVVLLVGLAANLAVAAGGPARAAWSPPDRLSTGDASGTPTLAFDARGWALATWAQRFGAGWRSASRAPSAAVFAPDRPSPDLGEEVVESVPPAPVVDRAGGVIAVQQRELGDACGGAARRYELTSRFGRVTGTFARAGRARVVFSRIQPPAVALAGNGRGAAAFVWREVQRDARGRCIRPTRELVRAVVRRPGHGFGAPVTLARSVSTGPLAAAVGAHDDVLAVWRRGRMLETRTWRRHGAWRPKRRISADRVGSIAAAMGADGSAYLVWSSWPGTNIPDGERTVRAATRPAHGQRFQAVSLGSDVWPAGLVDRPERRAVRLALLERGAIAAWTSWDGSHLRVLTATSRGRRFGTAQASTPPGRDYALGALAVSPAGLPAVALTDPVDPMTPPLTAFANRDGSFGLPEAVTGGAAGIGGQALAFSPVTGRPTLVWTQTTFANGPTTTTVASTRSAA